jgi:voltage-gated potassium channel
LRAARAARNAVRGLRLVRILASVNRGMGALGRTLRRRSFGYAVALTFIVTFTGAAGMYTFEDTLPDGRGLHSYGTAVWWTAMLMTTMGSEYWPHTPERRLLCLLLAIYAFAAFGYVTATLASFFVNRDAQGEDAELAGADAIEALRREIAALRTDVRAAPKPTAER